MVTAMEGDRAKCYAEGAMLPEASGDGDILLNRGDILLCLPTCKVGIYFLHRKSLFTLFVNVYIKFDKSRMNMNPK